MCVPKWEQTLAMLSPGMGLEKGNLGPDLGLGAPPGLALLHGAQLLEPDLPSCPCSLGISELLQPQRPLSHRMLTVQKEARYPQWTLNVHYCPQLSLLHGGYL